MKNKIIYCSNRECEHKDCLRNGIVYQPFNELCLVDKYKPNKDGTCDYKLTNEMENEWWKGEI